MKMNKKGIMVQFLLTVLLAIIIFTPACLFTSKLFRLSDQASDSYTQFINELKSFAANGKEGDRKIAPLIIDEESGIFFFKDKERQFFYEETEQISDTREEITEYVYRNHFTSPQACTT